MLRAMSSRVLGAALALSLCAGGALAMPQQAFDEWTETFDEKSAELRSSGGDRDAMVALYNEMLDQLTIADLKPSQIAWLSDHGQLNYTRLGDAGRNYTDEALAVVTEAKEQPTSEGAVAASLYAVLSMGPTSSLEDDVAMARAAVNHPGVKAALVEGNLVILNSLLAYQLHPDVRAELKDEFGAYLKKLGKASPKMIRYSDVIYERAAALDSLDEAELEQARQALLALTEKAIEMSEVEGSELASSNSYFKSVNKTLEAAPRIAKLVGNTAPELNFTWASSDEALATLADRQGKVLVLDFWATWCGPCVGTFPNVRDLVTHYDGYPVEVIGVTSLQGATWFGGERGKVEAPTADVEYAQMKEYIPAKDITWTVAFSEQEVFNADYGVRGIPHVVIIDPDGVIRHRGLHPAEPMKDKVEKINAILTEFDMPVPERAIPEETEN